MKTFDVCRVLMILAAAVGFCTAAVAQNLREVAREYAIRHPGGTMELPAPPGHSSPKTIAELTKESDVVLLCRLNRVSSYLNSDEDRVLTDYSIDAVNLVAGRLPVVENRTPGKTEILILTV